jgi:hypothetical protein
VNSSSPAQRLYGPHVVTDDGDERPARGRRSARSPRSRTATGRGRRRRRRRRSPAPRLPHQARPGTAQARRDPEAAQGRRPARPGGVPSGGHGRGEDRPLGRRRAPADQLVAARRDERDVVAGLPPSRRRVARRSAAGRPEGPFR